jgi:hypothetical protein
MAAGIMLIDFGDKLCCNLLYESSSLLLIQWTAHGQAATIQDMAIDHRRLHILVAKQFLHGSNIVATLQQVGGYPLGETVTERMATNVLRHPCMLCSRSDSLLQAPFAYIGLRQSSGFT